jgi:hypothetical protein
MIRNGIPYSELKLNSSLQAVACRIPTLGIRLCQALADTGINLDAIAKHIMPASPLWLLYPPGFDYTLFSLGTKSNTFDKNL